MTYDFTSLSPADFEDLCRDLVGAKLGVWFEAFAVGPDGGMDGRHSRGKDTTVLQAKHYAGSRTSDLTKTMKRERAAIERLAPSRYLLATSARLTAKSKDALLEAVEPWLRETGDIIGARDLNDLLRSNPNILKSHLKLWLSSTAVLERVLKAARHQRRSMTLDEIQEKVQIYAPNPSYNEALDTLEREHVLIISGPPGVGKTTLAEMLAYAHIAQGWEFVSIHNLHDGDGVEEISDLKKQVFYFDDFLGRVRLDPSALSRIDSDLARMIKRIRRSPNARFILTTRAPIFEEAKQFSEHLADRRLDISRYLLDVGIYTRRIKARILYNHLRVAGVPQTHILALLEGRYLPKIVDHKNFNPRLVALMADGSRIAHIDPTSYPDEFVRNLDDPTELWSIPFRKHIGRTCQHLLITLFFLDEFGTELSILEEAYEALHGNLAREFGIEKDPKDFEESLKILDGGFINISGSKVSLINPSLRDFLFGYLVDGKLLRIAAASATRVDFARAVWIHAVNGQPFTGPPPISELALSFEAIARKFHALPVKRTAFDDDHSAYGTEDCPNTQRVELLADWWFESGSEVFRECMSTVISNPIEGWDSWRDGEELINLVGKFRSGEYHGDYIDAEIVALALENGAIALLETEVAIDELEKFADAMEDWKDFVRREVVAAVNRAVARQFAENRNLLLDLDSESLVEDRVDILAKLAGVAGIADIDVSRIREEGEVRRQEIAVMVEEAESVFKTSDSIYDTDTFDDSALESLFAPLLEDGPTV